MIHLFDLMEKIVAAENGEVTLDIPEEKFNLLMLRILRAKAKAGNRSVNFQATGSRGKRLLAALSGVLREEEQHLPEGQAERPGKPVKMPRPPRKWRRIGLIAAAVFGGLLLLGGLAYGALSYLPKAEVILTLTPIPLVKEVSVVADTTAKTVDADKGTVPGTLQTVEETGTKSTPATGRAIVGEKAKGTVRFVNGTTSAVQISAGQRISEVDQGLIFLVDAAVTVPEVSSTTTATVTAEKIGGAYNLSMNSTFNVVSGVSAVNDGAFTGGSSEEVTVASAAEHTKLLDELQAELVEKAKSTIQSRSGIDEVVVDAAIKSEIMEKTYSHTVGEQAENVSLTLKIKLTTITYKGADIQGLVSQSLASLVPSGYTLFPGETEIEPLDPRLEADKLRFQAKISAKVVPQIDQEKIKADLAGRNPESALTYLDSLGDVSAYELKIWPNLPSGLQRIPRSIGRITVTLVTEEAGN